MDMEELKDRIYKRSILLPLRGTEEETKVITTAKSLSELLSAYIHILYLSEEPISKKDLLERLQVNRNEFPGFIVTHKSGDPAKVILEEAKKSDYLVINTENLSPVIINVIENTEIPVILMKPDTVLELYEKKWKPKRILFPLDGSIESAQAVDASLDIIKKTDPDIDVLHIFTTKEIKGKEASPGALFYQDHPRNDWGVWMKEFVKRFFPHEIKPEKISLSLSKGKAAPAILDFTKRSKVDMIVMAWQGVFGEDHAMILKDILSSIRCPVFLIRIKKERLTHYKR